MGITDFAAVSPASSSSGPRIYVSIRHTAMGSIARIPLVTISAMGVVARSEVSAQVSYQELHHFAPFDGDGRRATNALIQSAELSSRTFCTFPREFPSFRWQE